MNAQFRMRLLQELQELDLGDQQGQDLEELNQERETLENVGQKEEGGLTELAELEALL